MFTKKSLWIQLSENAIGAAAAVAIASLAVVFLSHKIAETSDATLKSRMLTKALKERSVVLSELSDSYSKVKGKEEIIENALIYSSNTLEFVSALESIANKDNVTMSVKFDTPNDLGIMVGNPPHSISEIRFTLSLQGNVFTFLEFFKDLERLPYFAEIQSMSLSSQAAAGWQNMSNIAVQGKIYTRTDN